MDCQGLKITVLWLSNSISLTSVSSVLLSHIIGRSSCELIKSVACPPALTNEPGSFLPLFHRSSQTLPAILPLFYRSNQTLPAVFPLFHRSSHSLPAVFPLFHRSSQTLPAVFLAIFPLFHRSRQTLPAVFLAIFPLFHRSSQTLPAVFLAIFSQIQSKPSYHMNQRRFLQLFGRSIPILPVKGTSHSSCHCFTEPSKTSLSYEPAIFLNTIVSQIPSNSPCRLNLRSFLPLFH